VTNPRNNGNETYNPWAVITFVMTELAPVAQSLVVSLQRPGGQSQFSHTLRQTIRHHHRGPLTAHPRQEQRFEAENDTRGPNQVRRSPPGSADLRAQHRRMLRRR
jgi:hypothetical protein